MNAKKLSRRSLLEHWWVLPVAGTLGAFGYMGWYATRITLGKHKAGAPQFEASASQKIVSLEQMSPEWAEVNFTYAGRPCVLLHVPEPVAGGLSVGGKHYAAFSRICTHLGCQVNLVRDQEVLAFAFNYRAPQDQRHPQLGCRCHFSVFNPLLAGEAVFGKATAPLPRVRLEMRGGDLYATGIEPAPKLAG